MSILHVHTHTHTHTHTHSYLVSPLSPCRLLWGDKCVSLSSLQRKNLISSPGLSAQMLFVTTSVCVSTVCVCVCLCVCTCGLSFSGTVVLNTGHTLQLTRWPLTSHLYTTTTLLDTLSRTDVQYWPQTNTLTNTHTPTHSFTNFCLNIWVFWQQIHTARIVFYDIFLISGFIFHVT